VDIGSVERMRYNTHRNHLQRVKRIQLRAIGVNSPMTNEWLNFCQRQKAHVEQRKAVVLVQEPGE